MFCLYQAGLPCKFVFSLYCLIHLLSFYDFILSYFIVLFFFKKNQTSSSVFSGLRSSGLHRCRGLGFFSVYSEIKAKTNCCEPDGKHSFISLVLTVFEMKSLTVSHLSFSCKLCELYNYFLSTSLRGHVAKSEIRKIVLRKDISSLISRMGGLIREIKSSQQVLSDVQVLIGDVLDFWNPTEHPGLCNSKINTLCVSRVCNYWLAVHRKLDLIFVENSIISYLELFQRGLLQLPCVKNVNHLFLKF